MPQSSVITDPVLTALSFLDKWTNVKFTDNNYQRWNAATFRELALDLATNFATLKNLTTNQVRGSIFRVPYIVVENGLPSVPTALIPADFRILGMDAIALNGTDAGSTLAGVKADPITFKLLRYASGTVDALVDEQPDTTATVKTHWVRTSGTDEQKVASYQELPIEDQNVYRGEVYQYTFENLTPVVTRLVEIKQDMTMFSHPLPTGEDDDPYYKNFAPLSSATYDDSQLRELIASLANARLTATATVLFADSGREAEEFSTHDSAQGVAAPGDLIILRGYHPEIIVKKSIDINAEGAVIAGLVANYLESGFAYTWRGGYFTQRIFTGRTVGVPHHITFERVSMGPNSFHQSHTNNTATPGEADRYIFRDSELTHVAANQRNDSNQYQSVFYDRCSFVPTTPGAVFRNGFHEQSIITALQCRFQPLPGEALFDSPTRGRFSLQGISTVGMTAGGVNLLSDGLRVINVANPFNPPATAQTFYPAGGTSDVTSEQLQAVATTLPATATRTANYTLQLTDAGYQIPVNTSSGVAITLPHFNDVAFPIGTIIEVSQEGSGPVSFTAGANAVVQALDGGLKTPGQYGVVGLRKINNSTWRVTGSIQ